MSGIDTLKRGGRGGKKSKKFKAQAKKRNPVSEEDKKTEKKSPQRQKVEDLVRRISQRSGAAKELGRLASPAISKK